MGQPHPHAHHASSYQYHLHQQRQEKEREDAATRRLRMLGERARNAVPRDLISVTCTARITRISLAAPLKVRLMVLASGELIVRAAIAAPPPPASGGLDASGSRRRNRETFVAGGDVSGSGGASALSLNLGFEVVLGTKRQHLTQLGPRAQAAAHAIALTILRHKFTEPYGCFSASFLKVPLPPQHARC
jgi:hypothetical protein